nr:hypothetical protein BaRGS_005819 [Batillaria attramentaria]
MLGFASVDVVSLDCEAVCQQELLFERHCAVQMGCYEPNILANDLLFIQCWQPCWENSNNCLSLCREQHAAIKDRCRKQCADIPEDKFCPGFCFAMAIDTLMNGQLNASLSVHMFVLVSY